MSKALNELKKATMASYLAKAGGRIRSGTKIGTDFENDAYKDMATVNKHHPNVYTPGVEKDPAKLASAEKRMNTNFDLAKTFKRDAANRIKGIARAGRLLAKEETLDEISSKVKQAYTAKRGSQLSSDKYGSGPQKLTGRQQKNAVKGLKRANEDVEQIDEVSRSTIAKVATARYQQAQTALKAKDFGGYVKKMGKAIKAADKTTPNVGWSPEDDNTKRNEEVVVSAQERYRQIKEAKVKKAVKKDYASGKGMRAYGDPPKGNVDYPNDPRNPKKVGE